MSVAMEEVGVVSEFFKTFSCHNHFAVTSMEAGCMADRIRHYGIRRDVVVNFILKADEQAMRRFTRAWEEGFEPDMVEKLFSIGMTSRDLKAEFVVRLMLPHGKRMIERWEFSQTDFH